MHQRFEYCPKTPLNQLNNSSPTAGRYIRVRSRNNLASDVISKSHISSPRLACFTNDDQDPDRARSECYLLQKECEILEKQTRATSNAYQLLLKDVDALQCQNTSLDKKLVDYFRRYNEMRNSLESLKAANQQTLLQLGEELAYSVQQQQQQRHECTQLSAISSELEGFKCRMLQEQQQVKLKFSKKITQIEQLEIQQQALMKEIHNLQSNDKTGKYLAPIIQSQSFSNSYQDGCSRKWQNHIRQPPK